MRFLIDECLSVTLVLMAGEAGYEAQHVARVGKAGWKDWNIVRYANDGDFTLVTNNASDFRRLYGVEPIHPGLMIILPSVDRPEQRQLFKAALGKLAELDDITNRVLEVDFEGDQVTFKIYELPSAAS